MSLRTRLLAPVTAALVGGLVAGLVALAPAAASAADQQGHKRGPDAVFKRSSYLCYGYQDCRDQGMGNAGYAQNNDKMYWRMYSGHNCTNYAAYRMVKSGLPNTRPWSGGGNAMYWGTSMPRITDDVPRVGAVAWWKANAGPAGSVGHVAYVEKVVSADEVIVSQDSWGGDFSWAVITRSSGNWPSGFVHFNDQPLSNQVAPVISGIAKVGSVLSSTPGGWKPADVQVSYQWSADGQKIAGATEPTLRVTKARLDQTLTVTTTATKLGYPTRTATSAPTAAVLPGTLKSVTAPALSGVSQVDSTLTLDTGTWTPAPDALTVQWLADGQPIEGATGAPTLSLTPDLVGATISATVTASRAGYDPVSATTAPSAPVVPGTFTVATAPSVLGLPEMGQALTVDTGAYHPTADTVAIQWLRDGVPIDGATGPSYQLINLDLGSRISARVTVSRAGYTDLSVDSPSTARIRTDPRIRVQTQRLQHKVKVTVTVSAPGLDVVDGVVVVRLAGVAQIATLRNGTARVVLDDLPPGKRTMTIRYAGSDTVNRLVVTRQVRVL
ncbi:CHAP domain-containing protein [Nocardioides sp. URHA0032]|uniref:CHAP domain-containing protein n=1 Tax=Nocardioides sp. URHA0032 TaxID=1380388 RepID=UPI0005632FEB|nr:CHAP domain-containing protein [Nocardioides sp. URHA0032]